MERLNQQDTRLYLLNCGLNWNRQSWNLPFMFMFELGLIARDVLLDLDAYVP